MKVSSAGARTAGLAALMSMVAACASGGEMASRVDALESELRDLRRSHALSSQRIREIDRLGQTTYLLQDSIEQLSLELEDLRTQQEDVLTRLKVLEAATFGDGSKPSVSADPSRSRPEPSRREVVGSSRSGSDEERRFKDPRTLYQHAYGAMEEEQLTRATEGFEELLDRWPKSDLADNAHYWLGEVFASVGDVDKAERHFKEILEEYPAGNKVPDAMYKLGVLAEDRGDSRGAGTWYRKVREQYPWSPVAEKAAQRMGAEGPSE